MPEDIKDWTLSNWIEAIVVYGSILICMLPIK